MSSLHLIADKIPDLDLLKDVKTGGILQDIHRLQAQVSSLERYNASLCASLSKDMILSVLHDEIELSAAVLNAAPAGTVKRTVSVTLGDSHIPVLTHIWAAFEGVATAAKVAGDPAAPAITQTHPMFDKGKMLLDLTFVTDEGDEEIYAEDDEYTLTVQVAADDLIHGVEVDPVVVTFKVVA